MPEHIVLAYSGGLDTSVVTHWLGQVHNAEVTCVLVDLGQASNEVEQAQERALANGAEACLVAGDQASFVHGYVAPAIQANALYEHAYPLATALARPYIAKVLVEAAHEVGADAIAHGCTGKGNDQVRLEASIHALDPSLTVLAPQRTDAMTRDEALAYAAEHDLELPELTEDAFSTDENLWGRSIEGGVLEDPTIAPPESAFAWTTSPKHAPDEPASITLTFEHGLPVALDGQALPLDALIAQLNTLAGGHGIGRIDHIENRLVGIKSRELYEAPAAVTILAAKQALEQLTLTKDVAQAKTHLEQQFSQLTYDGLWYSPLTQALQAFFAQANAPVTGTVTLEAYKGSLTVTSRESPVSLYDEGLATYGPEDGFDHDAASGFIQLWSLPLVTNAKVHGQTTSAGSSKQAAEATTEATAEATSDGPGNGPLVQPTQGGA